jgi:hypothetical protein
MNKQIREFAIILLDDEQGINAKAYEALAKLLKETGSEDILSVVEGCKDRYYLGEDDAEDLLKGISEWENPKPIKEAVEIKHTPLCAICHEVQTQIIMEEVGGGSEVVGCNLLTPKAWKDGWQKDGDKTVQNNCPLK